MWRRNISSQSSVSESLNARTLDGLSLQLLIKNRLSSTPTTLDQQSVVLHDFGVKCNGKLINRLIRLKFCGVRCSLAT